jgi:hypothetical protein
MSIATPRQIRMIAICTNATYASAAGIKAYNMFSQILA